jgi:hypothetical protein
VSDFERTAIQAVIDQATTAGIPVPDAIKRVMDHLTHDHVEPGGRLWAAAHPEENLRPVEAYLCCDAVAYYGPERCTCWVAVYDVEQATPIPMTGPDDIAPQPRMCGDCAYRPSSPERSEGFSEAHLLTLPTTGQPFWCHQGSRRPVAYRHPTLGDIPADQSDYRPPVIDGVPYRTDGRPEQLCAGWAALAVKASTAVSDG